MPYILFLVLLGWSLYDGSLLPSEAGWLGGILIVAHLLIYLFSLFSGLYIVAIVLVDIFLIMKVFGGDVQIR